MPAERPWSKIKPGLSDGANPMTTVDSAAAQGVPHINNVARRTTEMPQKLRRGVDVINLAVLHIAQNNNRAHYGIYIDAVAVETDHRGAS